MITCIQTPGNLGSWRSGTQRCLDGPPWSRFDPWHNEAPGMWGAGKVPPCHTLLSCVHQHPGPNWRSLGPFSWTSVPWTSCMTWNSSLVSVEKKIIFLLVCLFFFFWRNSRKFRKSVRKSWTCNCHLSVYIFFAGDTSKGISFSNVLGFLSWFNKVFSEEIQSEKDKRNCFLLLWKQTYKPRVSSNWKQLTVLESSDPEKCPYFHLQGRCSQHDHPLSREFQAQNHSWSSKTKATNNLLAWWMGET